MYGHANPTIRTTGAGEQVGPKMHHAVKLVGSRGPYRAMNPLAIAVGPNGSQDYGYRVVKRCIKKGLIALHPDHEAAAPGSRGAVILTDKGARYLNEHGDRDLNPDEYVDANKRYSEYQGEWC